MIFRLFAFSGLAEVLADGLLRNRTSITPTQLGPTKLLDFAGHCGNVVGDLRPKTPNFVGGSR